MKLYLFTLAYVNALKQSGYHLLTNHKLQHVKLCTTAKCHLFVLMNVFIVFTALSLPKALLTVNNLAHVDITSLRSERPQKSPRDVMA